MVLAHRAAQLHGSERIARPRAARTVDEILARLEEHPRRITSAIAGLSKAQLNDAPFAGTWSARDVLAHLRCCTDAGTAAVRGLARADGTVVKIVGPRTLIEQLDYRERDFAHNLQALSRQRPRLLALLRSVPRALWTRDGRVSDGRAARERSILDYGQWLARHEHIHVEQFERFGHRQLKATRGRTRASSAEAAASPRTGRPSRPATRRRASTRPT